MDTSAWVGIASAITAICAAVYAARQANAAQRQVKVAEEANRISLAALEKMNEAKQIRLSVVPKICSSDGLSCSTEEWSDDSSILGIEVTNNSDFPIFVKSAYIEAVTSGNNNSRIDFWHTSTSAHQPVLPLKLERTESATLCSFNRIGSLSQMGVTGVVVEVGDGHRVRGTSPVLAKLYALYAAMPKLPNGFPDASQMRQSI